MDTDLFRELIVSGPARRLRRWVWPASLVAHVVVAAVLFTVPILGTEDFPAPSAAVRAFFVAPEAPPTPPPPPPPPARTAERNVVRPPVQNQTPQLTAPVAIPDEIRDPATLDLGTEGGVAGGVEGGVAGGVLGGIVGGLPASALATAAQNPVSYVSEPRKLRAVPPVYPELARQARVQGAVVLDCVVDKRGRVAEVNVLNSASPLLNAAALEAVRQWVYAPTLVDGVPVRLRVKVTVTFNLNRAA